MTKSTAIRKLRIMLLVHKDLIPPEKIDGHTEKEIAEWQTEYDVKTSLTDLGHEVNCVGVHSDLSTIDSALEEFKPHITFNLLEEFHGIPTYNYSVVSYLELKKCAYTGCNPRGMLLSRDKSLCKKVLRFHRIRAPRFSVYPIGRKPLPPKRVRYPMLVKALREEASVGIAQASIVNNNEKLAERIEYMHKQIETDVIVEEYIDGRELYVGVIGNKQLQTFPIWEMIFANLTEGAPRIATAKVKWDKAYQKKIGLETVAAKDIPPDVEKDIYHLCKRIYRKLGLSGYARIDLRLTEDNKIHLLEVNPNPELAKKEDFAESAKHIGIAYPELLQKIITLGLGYKPLWRE